MEVKVKPFPVSPPPGYTGAVGNFSVSANLDKTTVKTNEPVNLKVVIKGNGNLKLIDLPSFRFPADLEVYDPKVKDQIEAGLNGISGSKTFDYLIIPRFPGSFEIPSWSFTWFDPSAGEFRTFTTNPMVIEVERGENDSEATVMSAPEERISDSLDRMSASLRQKPRESDQLVIPFTDPKGLFSATS
jgi:hypothetical protein